MTSVVFWLYNYRMADKSFTQYTNVFSKHHSILRASTAIKLGVPKHVLYKMLETGELI
jgi:hypothetical protein